MLQFEISNQGWLRGSVTSGDSWAHWERGEESASWQKPMPKWKRKMRDSPKRLLRSMRDWAYSFYSISFYLFKVLIHVTERLVNNAGHADGTGCQFTLTLVLGFNKAMRVNTPRLLTVATAESLHNMSLVEVQFSIYQTSCRLITATSRNSAAPFAKEVR